METRNMSISSVQPVGPVSWSDHIWMILRLWRRMYAVLPIKHRELRHANRAKVRMIKDVELDKLKYIYFDGRNKLGPPYNPD